VCAVLSVGAEHVFCQMLVVTNKEPINFCQTTTSTIINKQYHLNYNNIYKQQAKQQPKEEEK
jgi:hypothetical protein